jgi:TM2 domain-containing membrane protein YozV
MWDSEKGAISFQYCGFALICAKQTTWITANPCPTPIGWIPPSAISEADVHAYNIKEEYSLKDARRKSGESYKQYYKNATSLGGSNAINGMIGNPFKSSFGMVAGSMKSTMNIYKKMFSGLTGGGETSPNTNENNAVTAPPGKKYSKKWTLTLLLCIFFGVFGVHRFYNGKIKSGIFMLITFGGIGWWLLIDLIMIISGKFKDKQGNFVSR